MGLLTITKWYQYKSPVIWQFAYFTMKLTFQSSKNPIFHVWTVQLYTHELGFTIYSEKPEYGVFFYRILQITAIIDLVLCQSERPIAWWGPRLISRGSLDYQNVILSDYKIWFQKALRKIFSSREILLVWKASTCNCIENSTWTMIQGII